MPSTPTRLCSCLTRAFVYTVYSMSTRADILAAARQAFNEGGEAGLSLRDVAARVGLTPMAIYRHFENKQALLNALMMEGLEAWQRRIAAIKPCTPARWLIKTSDAYLDFALEDPRKFEAAFLLSSAASHRYPDIFLANRSPTVTLQLELVQRLVLGKRKAEDVLLTLFALSLGLVTLYRTGRIAGGEQKFKALYKRAMKNSLLSLTASADD